ncbi:hypothetical protein EPUS_03812 [Endocarpon pusillum Z07020]|uniref:EKC/KEOPS complex subunit BUD32 n=1 Tax=Endocarpon pusillum (strain Z07020 / HMAS-L-300199) TaxID=1263415 RepID=U1GNW8_ENDPU|nr:uncharacterized protein EPUS_03812 [Endocarpon pusillum Z07020]ERF73998.1 hypothetical protein EPUS_03812 [Endocarpon pusillum Z07020]
MPPPTKQVTRDSLLPSMRLAPDASPQIYRLTPTTVAKTGDLVSLSEAAVMRLVRSKTSIPVPQVLDAYIRTEDGSGHGCIIMEYVEGETLDKAWEACTPTQKDGIVKQLKSRLATDGPRTYAGLARSLRERRQNTWIDMVCRFIDALPHNHQIVLTHNDLAPRNILVREGRVVALLDWELAGFYPEHWEYVKTLFWPEWNSSWIKDGIVDRILDPYTLELACLLHARDIIW